MNFASAKKLIVSGITGQAFVSAAVAIYPLIYPGIAFPIFVTIYSLISTAMAVLGFVILFFTQSNILDLGIAGGLIISAVPTAVALIAGTALHGGLFAILCALYLAVWAFKNFTRGNLILTLILGAAFILSVLMGFGVFPSPMIRAAAAVAAAGAEAIAAYREKEE